MHSSQHRSRARAGGASWWKTYSLIVWLAVTGIASAEDWPAAIEQLKRAPSNDTNRKQLAVVRNNYAIELANQGQWDQAEKELQQALSLDKANDQFKQNLANVLVNHVADLRQNRRSNDFAGNAKAKSLLQQALRHNSRSAAAYLLLGDLAYDNQQLVEAKQAWTTAQRLQADLPGLSDRLQRLRSEQSVEGKFDRAGNAYFDFRYEGVIADAEAKDLRRVLDDARRDIGRDFAYWPNHKIVVLIYSDEAFRQIRPGPDWVAGLYDGKIRVPYQPGRAGNASLKTTLVHEYTHALVHDIAGNQCPIWLNEGLAEFQEAKVRPPRLDMLQAAAARGQLIPFAALPTAFQSRDGNVANLAYQQSYSFVSFLDQKYRFFRIKRILDNLAQGQSVDAAFETELRVPLSRVETDWRRWLPAFVKSQGGQVARN